MKKIAISAGLLVYTLIFVVVFGRSFDTDADLYPLAGIVTGIDRDTDAVEWTDYSGNEWSFYGIEDWMIGDGVAAIMDDNGTENVADDAIVSVRYVG